MTFVQSYEAMRDTSPRNKNVEQCFLSLESYRATWDSLSVRVEGIERVRPKTSLRQTRSHVDSRKGVAQSELSTSSKWKQRYSKLTAQNYIQVPAIPDRRVKRALTRWSESECFNSKTIKIDNVFNHSSCLYSSESLATTRSVVANTVDPSTPAELARSSSVVTGDSSRSASLRLQAPDPCHCKLHS